MAGRCPPTSIPASITTLVPVEDEFPYWLASSPVWAHGVAADAAGNRWDGTRMNLSYATSCLAVPRYRDRDHRRATAAA